MVENRGNFRSSEIPITLFENAFNTLETAYKTAANLAYTKAFLSHLTDQEARNERPFQAYACNSKKFLFVGGIPGHMRGFAWPFGKDLITLANPLRKGEFTELILHTFSAEDEGPLEEEHYYLIFRKTHSTATERPSYELALLYGYLNFKYLLNPEQEVSEGRKASFVTRADMHIADQGKESILKDLIEYVPSWTQVRISPIK